MAFDYHNPMQVLLTGGSGMLGTAIQNELLKTTKNFFAPSSKDLDLLDFKSCQAFFAEHKIEYIIHCAAIVGGIKANIDHPYKFLDQNIRIDSNLFDLARSFKVKNLVYIASSCMYPKNSLNAMSEEIVGSGPLEVTNEGYALAKLVGTKKVSVTAQELGLTWRSLILSNLYGPGDHFGEDRSHLVAAIIKKAAKAKTANLKTIEMWGDGSAKREFTYVSDVAEFIVDNLKKLERFPMVLNLGSGVDYSVKDYYQAVLKSFDLAAEIKPDVSKPSGMQRKLMNIDRARSLGWIPKTSLEQGLKLTIEWYSKQVELKRET
jgi:GDP-L-fucose synthase